MANTKSSYKRIEISERNRLRNRMYKSSLKTSIRKTLNLILNLNNENIDNIKSIISLSYSRIDKAVQKGVIHSNNGSSKKASLIKHFRSQQEKLQKRT